MRVAISQPMFFPWSGFLAMLDSVDIFIHLNDVQFAKGSFTNRVQVKRASGLTWVTVPLKNHHLGQTINDVRVASDSSWKQRHLNLFQEVFQLAPYRADALSLVSEVYGHSYTKLVEISEKSVSVLSNYFGTATTLRHLNSDEFDVKSQGSQRVLDLVLEVGGTTYVSGLGGLHYLDHEKFEACGVSVEYMKYNLNPYCQPFGEFTPYVTALVLIAHSGPSGSTHITSETKSWREINGQK